MKSLGSWMFSSAMILGACGGDDGSGDDEAAGSSDDSTSDTPSTTDESATTPSSSGPDEESSSSASTMTDPTTTTDPDSSTTAPADDSSSGSTTETGDASVVLNELSSNNDGKIGEDPIEIHNAGDAELDLSGWIITDDLAAPEDPYDVEADEEEYVFPEGTVLAAGEFIVVVGGDLPDGHPFGLSGDGDAVSLIDPTFAVVDFVSYAAMEADVSYCRMPDGPDGVWAADCAPTFGMTNG
jgi:hypothetical protein